MLNCTKTYVHQIDKDISLTKDNNGYGTVDIWSLVQRLAVDVIGETAFGHSFQTVENKSHFIPDAIAEMMRTSAIKAGLPLLSKILLINTEDKYAIIKKVNFKKKKLGLICMYVLILFLTIVFAANHR
jgi:hypothetical protein